MKILISFDYFDLKILSWVLFVLNLYVYRPSWMIPSNFLLYISSKITNAPFLSSRHLRPCFDKKKKTGLLNFDWLGFTSNQSHFTIAVHFSLPKLGRGIYVCGLICWVMTFELVSLTFHHCVGCVSPKKLGLPPWPTFHLDLYCSKMHQPFLGMIEYHKLSV